MSQANVLAFIFEKNEVISLSKIDNIHFRLNYLMLDNNEGAYSYRFRYSDLKIAYERAKEMKYEKAVPLIIAQILGNHNE